MRDPSAFRNVHYNQTGHAHFLTFSTFRNLPLLTNTEWRASLATHVRFALDHHQFALWAYVFMPDHVHLLVKPRLEHYDMARFEQDAKGNFSGTLLAHLRNLNSPLLDKLQVPTPTSHSPHRVWQRGGGHDFNVYTQEKAEEKANYCHNNPVKAGLVKRPDQWRWSSYRWLILGEREGAPLPVDEWDWSLIDE